MVSTPRQDKAPITGARHHDPIGEVSQDELATMYEAAAELLECQRVLAKTRDNVVTEVLRGEPTFQQWEHYPRGDVFDPETHSQFYYHTHVAHERVAGEHGHFHTFVRPAGLSLGVSPAPVPDFQPPAREMDLVAHLVGVSVDAFGQVFRLFTTNRWVTAETWYAADDVIRMLDHFDMDLGRPSWPLNRWLTATLRLFRPQIRELIRERDIRVAHHQEAHPDTNVYEDRSLNVTSEVRVSVEEQVEAIEARLGLGDYEMV